MGPGARVPAGGQGPGGQGEGPGARVRGQGWCEQEATEAQARAMGRFVETLKGNYIAAEDVGVNEQFFYWIANTCSFAFGYEPQKLFLDTSEKESFLKNNEDISKKDFRDVLLAIHLLANYKTFPNKTVAYYFTAYQDFDPDFKFAKSDINTERNMDISGAFGTKINRISKDIYQPLGQKQYGGTLMSKGIKIFERFLTETNQLKLQKKGDKYTGAFPYVTPEHQWTWTNEKK